jgi:spermidine synthase
MSSNQITPPKQAPNLGLFLLVVVLTGFVALLYQVTWQRMLGLFSGSDVRSATLVTSAFLSGLGLGSLVGSLWADRLSHRGALRLYGAANVGIGLFALCSRLLFYDLLFLQLAELSAYPAVLFGIVFGSLLLPTLLMGLGMPLLSRALVYQLDEAPGLITRLYALNTLGAAYGTFIGGWLLLGNLGYEFTAYLGGSLSLLIGVGMLSLAGRFSDEVPPHNKRLQLGGYWSHIPPLVWRWCLLVFVSGFVVIALELLWFRLLEVLLKSNAYTYAHILTIFLLGDALGSLIGRRFLQRIQQPRRVFFIIQGLLMLYALLSILLIAYLSLEWSFLNDYIRESRGQVDLSLEGTRYQWAVYLSLPLLLMFIPTLLIGFYFPVVQKAIQTDLAAVGQRVGLVEMANIAGNALGGLVGGLVLLEFVGTAGALRVLILVSLGFMAVLLWEQWRGFQVYERALWGGVSLCLALGLVFFPDNASLWAWFHAVHEDESFVMAEDSTGVTLIRTAGESQQGLLYAGGRFQGAIPYSSTHVFLGLLPALTHPNPQRAFVVGIGSSGTPYALGAASSLKEIVAVEIVGSELAALEDFATLQTPAYLRAFLNDPRYKIVVGDGRQELLLSDGGYDIIEADAILPISSGSGMLYSREYFMTARDRLAPGGIMAQWRPTQRTEDTFASVFPYVVVVGNYMLGSLDPIPYDAEQFLARLQDPAIIAYLEAVGVDLTELEAKVEAPSQLWTPETPRPSAGAAINSDLFPHDEYYLNGR